MSAQKTSQPKQILLADDGSQHSQAAIQLICDLPFPADTHITVVSVFTPLQASNHEAYRESLEKSKACLYQRGLDVKTELMLGYPAEKIVELAESLKPDLIILGAKGLRATLGILLGGVAQQVVEYANQPVLVVRAPYKPIKGVLFATDGSEYSQRAAEYLLNFPLPADAQLHLLHAVPPAPLPIQQVPAWSPVPDLVQPPAFYETEEAKKMVEQQFQRGKELLEKTSLTLQPLGLNLVTELCRGDAATEIINYLKTHPIELVVVGSRGLGAVRGWLLGSVSRKIIHYSGCSVLVVKD